MKSASSNSRKKTKHLVKRCPECGTYLRTDARRCTWCDRPVGKGDRHGVAKKPVDWKAYAACIISAAGFVFYMWWAFFA